MMVSYLKKTRSHLHPRPQMDAFILETLMSVVIHEPLVSKPTLHFREVVM